ncbi:C4-dicarboxylate ABC transporter substrate-binding protein [Anaerobacillus arseniciselenatis]|uniref:C4-dicarboxylate ABC transporter substrate-binding protein n=1 Tax=Anaerobacillus arseniciselenatis TaxID=85682 RepID=A0A1S2L9G0_9BACI|nr:TRAP transporter substrate-binding protein [Anaerobacillus arseniciselenatis]OIJ08205.1 C4-dicarboxylate ABC transporter substrate-binding protein [Anaerobacillus arseniciselenatis]
MKYSFMGKLGIGLMLLFLTVAAGCSSEDAGGSEVKTIKVANYFAEDHPQNVALREKFKPLVEEKSEGTLKVEIYPNSQLGAEQEFYDGVRNGTIEMGIPGMIMQSTIEKLAVPEWPFLFEDYEHVKRVFNGPIGDELVEDLESVHGVKALAWSANGFRMFSSNKTLNSIDDFDGLRLRMPNIPNYIELGQRLGANVTPLAISEVFTGLEQRVIDGQDNPIATTRASGWYEVQSDVLESNHMFSPNLYIINADFWNGLTPEQQEIVQEVSAISAAYEFELMEQSFEDDKKYLQEQGIQFTIPDDEFRQAMIDAVQPMYEDWNNEYDWAEDLVERIRAEAN